MRKAAAEVAGLGVTPCGPSRQTWDVLLTFVQERFAVDSVERVGEVNFEEHGGGVSGVAFAPLARRLKADFSSQGLGNADLQGEEQAAGPVLILGAQAFSG